MDKIESTKKIDRETAGKYHKKEESEENSRQ